MPSSTADRPGLFVVADARFENQMELGETLAVPAGAASTDIHLFLFLFAAYREWGRRCVDEDDCSRINLNTFCYENQWSYHRLMCL